MDKIKALRDRIDALTIRERGMILLAVLAVIIFLWNIMLMQPLDARQARLQAILETKRAEVSALNLRFGQLVRLQNEDPDAANRAELQRLHAELAELEQRVVSTTNELVVPGRMPELLRNVINRTSGLTLTGLEGLGATPLLTREDGNENTDGGKENDESDAGLTGAYKHGMRISFRGDYLATLEYLRKLEALDWRFFWHSIEFEVKDYPASGADIILYTLSLDRDWIEA